MRQAGAPVYIVPFCSCRLWLFYDVFILKYLPFVFRSELLYIFW
jgi:hypothetical protein